MENKNVETDTQIENAEVTKKKERRFIKFFKSKKNIAISLSDAKAKGYTACSKCNP